MVLYSIDNHDSGYLGMVVKPLCTSSFGTYTTSLQAKTNGTVEIYTPFCLDYKYNLNFWNILGSTIQPHIKYIFVLTVSQ